MKEQFKKAAEFISQNCTADDYSFFIYDTDTQDTRYAQNMITQNMTGTKLNIRLSVAFGNKTGSATVNSFEESSLLDMIKTAETIAKMNKPDPEYVESASKAEYPKVNNVASGTENCTIDDIVQMIQKIIDNAKSKNVFVSGLMTRSISDFYTSTKNGFEGFDRSSSFSNSMTMSDNINKEVKVARSVKDFNEFPIDKEIEELNFRFDTLSGPKAIEKGTYNVILRPQAVLNFFSFLLYFYDRRSADYKITPFHDSIGKQLFGENFSLISTFSDPTITASPFSSDGIIGKDTEWIKDGVLKNLFTTRSYAKKIGVEPNLMANLIISGGDTDEKEMMKKVENGIIINNFWYIRNVSTRKGELTGLTRDGMYYFENGEIKHSVVNLRFNELAIEVTKRILALGKEEQLTDNVRVPSMLIKDFTFVDTTTF